MSADSLLKIAPLIGGTLLIVVSLIAILRNPAISNVFAGLLALGALFFVIPELANFKFKGLGLEFSGEAATTGQVTELAASINARLEDIKSAVADLGKSAAPAAPPSAEFTANRNLTVVVVYSGDPKAKAIAKQMESALLKKGYQASSVYSDYSELSSDQKGQPGSVRYVYVDAAKIGDLKQLLKPETSSLTVLPDSPRQQMAASAEILLF
jgi:hypothetical protein